MTGRANLIVARYNFTTAEIFRVFSGNPLHAIITALNDAVNRDGFIAVF
jgi:hypothetical protein